MKKISEKDFIEKFSEQELKFLKSWEALERDFDFQIDYLRVSLAIDSIPLLEQEITDMYLMTSKTIINNSSIQLGHPEIMVLSKEKSVDNIFDKIAQKSLYKNNIYNELMEIAS